tara:strand:- start:1061 stop:1321 length:261 start_codon:yes stop_codon:yes gene_type:complete
MRTLFSEDTMKKIFLLLFLIASTVGCAELIAYTIGTASQVSGDLIKETFIDKKKKVKKELIVKATSENETVIIKESPDECKDCKND